MGCWLLTNQTQREILSWYRLLKRYEGNFLTRLFWFKHPDNVSCKHAKISGKRKATDKVTHLIIFYRSLIWSETADNAVVSLKNNYRKLNYCVILTHGKRVVSPHALLPATFQTCVFLINSSATSSLLIETFLSLCLSVLLSHSCHT